MARRGDLVGEAVVEDKVSAADMRLAGSEDVVGGLVFLIWSACALRSIEGT